jgi:hypothetical protein
MRTRRFRPTASALPVPCRKNGPRAFIDASEGASKFTWVSPSYFETMGIALRRGRFPSEDDHAHKIAIVSEGTARNVWPGEGAIGKRIRNDPKTEWVEVIGVVADVAVPRSRCVLC